MNVLYLCPLCSQHIVGWRAGDPAPNYCDRCNRAFPPGVRPRLLDTPPPPPKTLAIAALREKQANPRLVAPHECHACKRQLVQAFNKLRTENMHLGPDARSCRTSVYALLFNPPCCGAYLEAPARLAGTVATCPACGERIDIPHDLVLRREVPPAEPIMAFDCPMCQAVLHAPLAHEGRPVAGLKAVCIACSRTLEVPSIGRAPQGRGRLPSGDA
ncbi:MAG: hypothetical protein K2W96_05860 [Gemmataceae bacterium]|nr:hypothetical protein [Gemmataceae bacterium]